MFLLTAFSSSDNPIIQKHTCLIKNVKQPCWTAQEWVLEDMVFVAYTALWLTVMLCTKRGKFIQNDEDVKECDVNFNDDE